MDLVRAAAAGALLACALGLWLAGAERGRAETANMTQGVAASVSTTISWGSAGGCTQAMGAYDFGSVGAGSSVESSTFTGCVSSNKKWSVNASMTTEPSNGGEGASIPASSFVGRVTAVPSGGSTSCPEANTSCTLDASRTLVSNANRTANSFSYKYQLNMPSDQPGGSYTGGNVTFVASN